MEKIEITTPEPEKALPVLRDAVERQKRLLSQSIARTQEKIQQLAVSLQVDPGLRSYGDHPRIHARGVPWYGVKEAGNAD